MDNKQNNYREYKPEPPDWNKDDMKFKLHTKTSPKAIIIVVILFIGWLTIFITLLSAIDNVGWGNALIFISVLTAIYGFNYGASRQHGVPIFGTFMNIIVSIIALYLIIKAAYFD